MKTTSIQKQIVSLQNSSVKPLTKAQIASTLNSKGYTKENGNKITAQWVGTFLKNNNARPGNVSHTSSNFTSESFIPGILSASYLKPAQKVQVLKEFYNVQH